MCTLRILADIDIHLLKINVAGNRCNGNGVSPAVGGLEASHLSTLLNSEMNKREKCRT